MKAIVCTKYGSPDVLELREVEKPTPKGNEVLIQVYAASVTAADGMMRDGIPFYGRLFIGLMRPSVDRDSKARERGSVDGRRRAIRFNP